MPRPLKQAGQILEPVQNLGVRGSSSIILPRTRKNDADVLYVRQGVLTQFSAKFAEKTCAPRF